jgi:uncharacterized membrane protein
MVQDLGMSTPPTDRGLDRLMLFTDAIVAIAITLLILPLVDAVPTGGGHRQTVADFLADHGDLVEAFVLSFVVIARLWRVHHALFQHVRAYDNALMTTNLAWSFTIVVLPFPTAIIADGPRDRLGTAIYIGTMALSSIALSVMCVMVRRNPMMNSVESPLPEELAIPSIVMSMLFVVAAVIGSTFSSINLWSLLVLLAAWPISRFVLRRRARPPVRQA